MKYENPIIPGFYPDPSICRVGNDFYLATSSFEYFPGVPLFHSKNLVNWEQIGHCLTRKSQLDLTDAGISGGIYAPTLRYHNGQFYMITTNISNGGCFYVRAEDPAGEWSGPIWLNHFGIDPDLFWDEDGSVYFSCAGGPEGITQAKLNIENGEYLTKPAQTWKGRGYKCPEAPHLYKIDGYYYLMIAEGGTEYGHCVSIARSSGPMGPWESCPSNPILTHRSRELPIQAAGHADIIQDQFGSWWMVCLGIRPQGYHPFHVLGRETFLAPVKWENGWPEIGRGGWIEMETDIPSKLPEITERHYSTRDDFDGEKLPFRWNFLGNPVKNSYRLNPEDSRLELSCHNSNLNTMKDLSWLGRRQRHFNFRVSAKLKFNPAEEHEEAGIAVFQNIHHHYEVALTIRNGSPTLITRRTIGSLSKEEAAVPFSGDRLVLIIEGDEEEYRLGFLDDDSNPAILAKGEARYLSTEAGGRFTGVYLAMYAASWDHSGNNIAHFDWFSYEPADKS